MSDMRFAHDDAVEQLKQQLRGLWSLRDVDLARVDLGRASFQAFMDEIDLAIRRYCEVRDFDLSRVPVDAITGFRDLVAELHNVLSGIRDYQTQASSSFEQVDKWAQAQIRSFRQVDARVAREYAFLQSIAGPKDKSVEEVIDSADQRLSEVISSAAAALKEVEAKKASVESLAERVNEAVQTAVVGHFANIFDDQAKEYQSAARRWIVFAGSAALLTLGLAWRILDVATLVGLGKDAAGAAGIQVKELSALATVQAGLAKLVFFSTLYFVIVWAARTARSLQHNSIICQHRRNALKTFQAFVDAAGSDQAVRDAILVKAADAIFAHAATGYVGAEGDGAGNTQVFEMIRNIGGASGSAK